MVQMYIADMFMDITFCKFQYQNLILCQEGNLFESDVGIGAVYT